MKSRTAGAASTQAPARTAPKGLAAVAATFASYALRMGISKRAGVPVALVGVGEDALVVGGGAALLRGQQPARGEWRPL